MRRTVPPSAEIQAEIDKLLGKRMVDDPQKMLSELARLGARLIIQRAVEEESTPGWAALGMSAGQSASAAPVLLATSRELDGTRNGSGSSVPYLPRAAAIATTPQDRSAL